MSNEKLLTPKERAELLDYFAAAALQGILANPEHTHLTSQQVAKMSYTFATVMVATRGQHDSERMWVTDS